VANKIGGIKNWIDYLLKRELIVGTMVFCMVCVGYVMVQGHDTVLNERIVDNAFYLAGWIIAAYVFGAVFQQRSQGSVELPNKLDPAAIQGGGDSSDGGAGARGGRDGHADHP
jgi:hypothetical protein